MRTIMRTYSTHSKLVWLATIISRRVFDVLSI